jgi:hypothetical protein
MGRKAYRREALRLEKELGDDELRAHTGLNGNRALGWVHCGGARYGLHASSGSGVWMADSSGRGDQGDDKSAMLTQGHRQDVGDIGGKNLIYYL